MILEFLRNIKKIIFMAYSQLKVKDWIQTHKVKGSLQSIVGGSVIPC